jgi:DNA-binding response OmpR family regulator
MLKDYLVKEGFIIATSSDGEEGVRKFLHDSFDLVILDIMMPKLNGMEVMQIIRDRSAIPILIMSARDSEVDKAIGLRLGADDYITKPFSLVEVSARINAAIRRATKYNKPNEKQGTGLIHFRDLVIDLDNFLVVKNDEKIKLTLKEFDILKLFITNPKKVFTKSQIYNLIWKDDYFGDENAINVHMRRLREKIGDDASNPKYIKTLWGIGYKLEDF